MDQEHIPIDLRGAESPEKLQNLTTCLVSAMQVEEAQKAYLRRFWLMVVVSHVAYKVGTWFGLPLTVSALFFGRTSASDAGFFLLGLGLLLRLAVVVSLLPGFKRVEQDILAEADGPHQA